MGPTRRTARPAENVTADASQAIAVVPALPPSAEPQAVDWDALLDAVASGEPAANAETSVHDVYVPSFQVSENARDFLDDLGCPPADVDACMCKDDLDALFDIWRDKPPVSMLANLRRRGMTDLSRVTTKAIAQALLSRLKNDTPASKQQKDYIKVLQRRANINKAIPDDLSEAATSTMITTLIKNTPATDKQLAELRRLGGVDQQIVRTMFPCCFLPIPFPN